MHGTHCIKTWSSTQGIIALSSAEAEYYGIVKAASQGIGIRSLCADFDRKVSLEILTDASAARSIANRMGLGKVRHIDTHFLWVQQRVHRGDFIVSKVWGKENPADLLTKFLDNKTMINCMEMFGLMYMTGRSAEAPQLGNISFDASAIRGIRNPLLHNPERARQRHAPDTYPCKGEGIAQRVVAPQYVTGQTHPSPVTLKSVKLWTPQRNARSYPPTFRPWCPCAALRAWGGNGTLSGHNTV